MMKRMRYLSIILSLAIGCSLLIPPMIGAQPRTHTVVKGDTLWDICEKYYGDSELWPKLWEMNPFVTNPHLLNPGDIITLLEEVPVKKMKVRKEEKKEEEVIPEPTAIKMGIDVSSFINIKSIGYLSLKKFSPWGTIFSADSNKIILAKGDTIFVHFYENKEIKPGDEFTICKSSPRLKHPLTGRALGYIIYFNGRFVIKEQIKSGIYKAEIVDHYRSLHVGDMVIPYQSISPCVQPTPLSRNIVENIAAVRDQKDIIGQFSIVYLDRGFNHGIRRGALFEAVKRRVVPDPTRKHGTVYETREKLVLPDVVLGRLIILESRPDTATAFVLSTQENFKNGDFIKGLTWVEQPEFISSMPTCPIQ